MDKHCFYNKGLKIKKKDLESREWNEEVDFPEH
jgi:hypothetical protein